MRILKVKLEMMPKHLCHPIAPTVLVITNQAEFASMPMLAHAVMCIKGKTNAYDIVYIFAIIEKAPLYLDAVFSEPWFSGIVLTRSSSFARRKNAL